MSALPILKNLTEGAWVLVGCGQGWLLNPLQKIMPLRRVVALWGSLLGVTSVGFCKCRECRREFMNIFPSLDCAALNHSPRMKFIEVS